MTLFISVLLIKGFNMEWWWYLIASVIWAVHFKTALGHERKLDALSTQNFEVKDRILEAMEE